MVEHRKLIADSHHRRKKNIGTAIVGVSVTIVIAETVAMVWLLAVYRFCRPLLSDSQDTAAAYKVSSTGVVLVTWYGSFVCDSVLSYLSPSQITIYQEVRCYCSRNTTYMYI